MWKNPHAMQAGVALKTLARPSDKTALLRRLRTVRPESARRWGRMSAHQMVCHLADAFRMVTGEKPVRNEVSVFHRTILKWLVLYLPLQWPGGILTSPAIDQEKGGTKPGAFVEDVAQVEALLEIVTAPTANLDRKPHPMFGRMSHAAWLRWGYLHVDHHLRQFGA